MLTFTLYIEVLLDQLPKEVGDKLVAERLSSLHPNRLYSIADQIHGEVSPKRGQPWLTHPQTLRSLLSLLTFQAVNTIVPIIFPRAQDDVKLGLVLESVPKLTKLLRQN